jgi:hypothetical protein
MRLMRSTFPGDLVPGPCGHVVSPAWAAYPRGT